MPVVTTAAAATVLAVFAAGLAATIGRRGAGMTWRQVVTGIRLRHLGEALPVLAFTVAVAAMLLTLPVLELGWWRLLGGQGNPVLGRADGTGAWAAAHWLFLLGFVIAIPVLALDEERIFRSGAEARSARSEAASSLGFGLTHAVAGVPLGAALAMAVPGLWFAAVYRRAWRRSSVREIALLDAARAHATWNLLVVAVLAGLALAT